MGQINFYRVEVNKFRLGESDPRIYLGYELLYPKESSFMFRRTSSNGDVFEYECDGTKTLTAAITCSGITSGTSNYFPPISCIEFGDCVEEIGEKAFYWWANVNCEVKLPRNLKRIGELAFAGCNNISGRFVIPSSVEYIGRKSLFSFNKLECFVMESNVPPTLDTEVFDGNTCPIYVPCDSVDAYKTAPNWKNYASLIQGWDIENDEKCLVKAKAILYLSNGSNNVIECGEDATIYSAETETYKSNCKSIEFGSCIDKIGIKAFSGFTSLSGNLYIPNNITTIDEYAFANCSGLTGSLTFSDNLINIKTQAFYRCGFKGKLTLPKNLQELGIGVFQRCSGFTGDVIIPSGVTQVRSEAFNYCSGLSSVHFTSQYPPTFGGWVFDGTDFPIYVPCESLELYKTATNLKNYADRMKTERIFKQEVTGTMCVGDDLYEEISWLYSDNCGNSWSIDTSRETEAGKLIEEGAAICSRPSYPFAFQRIAQNGSAYTIQCDATSAQTISSGQTRSGITTAQVSGNTAYSPEKVIFGDCCKVINTYACDAFRYTKSFILSDSVEQINTAAFRNTYFCNEFVTGSGLKTIANNNNAIPNCVSGTTDGLFDMSRTNGVTIPSGATNLSNWADIRIGDNCVIGANNFRGLKRPIKNLTFGINTVLNAGSSSSSSVFGDNVFVNSTLDLSNLVRIGDYAFYNISGVDTVILGYYITSISRYCFSSNQINSVYIKSNVPPTLGLSTFNNTCIFYVPCGTSEAYKSASNWSTFASRIQEWDFDNDTVC